jgi:hypothetical protein
MEEDRDDIPAQWIESATHEAILALAESFGQSTFTLWFYTVPLP